LPEWAERLKSAVRIELQVTGDKFTDLMVLPPDLMPLAQQRQMMTDHRDNLRSSLLDTPAISVAAETKVATAVSKLLTVLAGERKSDLVEEARSDIYLDGLDDIAWWAVDSAVRAWFRHDCGTDERGRPYDYKWAPDPGTLRKIALKFTYPIRARIGAIQRVLEAREYVDCTKQLAAGRAALDGMNKAIKAGDLDAARSLTFDEAVKLGSSNVKTNLLAQEAAE
jgi:DNA-binding FrmR family transcriptional regulator